MIELRMTINIIVIQFRQQHEFKPQIMCFKMCYLS